MSEAVCSADGAGSEFGRSAMAASDVEGDDDASDVPHVARGQDRAINTTRTTNTCPIITATATRVFARIAIIGERRISNRARTATTITTQSKLTYSLQGVHSF